MAGLKKGLKKLKKGIKKRVNCNNKIKILKKLGNLHKKTGCFLPDAGTVQPVFLYIFTKREKEGIRNKSIFNTIPNPFR